MKSHQRWSIIFFTVVLVFLPQVTFAVSKQKNRITPHKNSSFMPFSGTLFSDTVAVLDVASGAFLYRQDARKQRSIASLTKLFTTLVFLEMQPNLDQLTTYQSSYERIGAAVALNDGEQVSLKQVLMGALIPSANNMAEMLVRATPYTSEQFFAQVNGRAEELRLGKTHIVESTGLDPANVSTAGNLARFAAMLFTMYPDIFHEAAVTRRYQYFVKNTGREVLLYSTNKFDGHGRFDIVAFKTGYLPGSAERTLVAKIRDRAASRDIIVVLLGNAEHGSIFEEAYELTDWAFQNFDF